MKIKTLAIAAATLAVGAITSQAQVYSQNVVGYVNVVCPATNYILLANPLTTGNDVLTNVLHGVPGASLLYWWNGNGWNTYSYSAVTGHWKQGANVVDNTNIPPGAAFFLYAASTFTNTFTGTIAANTGGGTATNALAAKFVPVGSVLPYADSVTNVATVNLITPGASILETWNVAGQHYDAAYSYSAVQKVWKVGGVATNLSISVGQGFFLDSASATNWVQTLQ